MHFDGKNPSCDLMEVKGKVKGLQYASCFPQTHPPILSHVGHHFLSQNIITKIPCITHKNGCE